MIELPIETETGSTENQYIKFELVTRMAGTEDNKTRIHIGVLNTELILYAKIPIGDVIEKLTLIGLLF